MFNRNSPIWQSVQPVSTAMDLTANPVIEETIRLTYTDTMQINAARTIWTVLSRFATLIPVYGPAVAWGMTGNDVSATMPAGIAEALAKHAASSAELAKASGNPSCLENFLQQPVVAQAVSQLAANPKLAAIMGALGIG